MKKVCRPLEILSNYYTIRNIMNKTNKAYSARLENLGVRFPEVLLPSSKVDPKSWAVIACDQHTSDREYWNQVAALVNDQPSTLGLVFPEVYLEDSESQERISAIQRAMIQYDRLGLFRTLEEGLVYIQRETEESGLRQGILLAMDLEKYDFSPESKSLIRATEGTILERIPPRVEIRKGAPLELPHIMILIDDQDRTVIEPLESQVSHLEPLYDLDLMLGGGHLKGYNCTDALLIEGILRGLEQLSAQGSFLFAMGDGNHSLATAKTVWEELKAQTLEKSGSLDSLTDHPARFALAEIVNLHSPGLRFEPIHRVVFSGDLSEFLEVFRTDFQAKVKNRPEAEIRHLLEKTSEGQFAVGVISEGNWYLVEFPRSLKTLPNGLVDKAFINIREKLGRGTIDFIHGWDHTKRALKDSKDIGFFFPVIARERLFDYVAKNGPLPRKAFSMGDAQEKRYYMEARRIVPK